MCLLISGTLALSGCVATSERHARHRNADRVGQVSTLPAPISSAESPTPENPPVVVTPALAQSQPAATVIGSTVLLRLSEQLAPIDCTQSDVVDAYARLMRHPKSLIQRLERAVPMLHYVLAEIEAHDLPGQFALIPWVESSFQADPGNRGTVQGLWQFTESTGRAHGLRIDQRHDGRRSVIESTAAAIDHLESLQREYNDWRLSLLAYNAGSGRVNRGLARRASRRDRLPSGLAPHSYAYLHTISALGCLLAQPPVAMLERVARPFETLHEFQRPIGVSTTTRLANALGVTPEELRRYNAAFRGGDIADNAPLGLLLPATDVARITAAVKGSPLSETIADAQSEQPPPPRPPTESTARHVVRAGDNLWQIARNYRIGLADLLRWNRLDRHSIIRPGQTLRIAPD